VFYVIILYFVLHNSLYCDKTNIQDDSQLADPFPESGIALLLNVTFKPTFRI